MKYIFVLIILSSLLFACNQQTNNTQVLQNRIDSLETKLTDTYKPGFGELMSNIQAHHAKLWFAGQNKNWKLAQFEVHEIMESLEDIKKYQTIRKETQMITMMNPALDSIKASIEQQNQALFISSYTLLTNACNRCHRNTDFEYNVVKIPDTQSFSNQDFKSSN